MENQARQVRIAVAGLWLSAHLSLGGYADIASASHLERTIAENACEADGIQKLVDVMRHATFEVMRVYIPAGESRDKCQWIEIGRGESDGGAATAMVQVDREHLAHLMVKHSTLHLYHSHPLVHFEGCADTPGCADLSGPASADALSERGLIANLRYSMPSPVDIAFMLDVSLEFDQHRHDDGKMSHRVITPYGIVEYSLTDRGKERLQNDGMEGREGRWGFDTYIKTRVSYALADSGAIIKQHPSDLLAALKHLARHLSNEYLRVTYTPF